MSGGFAYAGTRPLDGLITGVYIPLYGQYNPFRLDWLAEQHYSLTALSTPLVIDLRPCSSMPSRTG